MLRIHLGLTGTNLQARHGRVQPCMAFKWPGGKPKKGEFKVCRELNQATETPYRAGPFRKKGAGEARTARRGTLAAMAAWRRRPSPTNNHLQFKGPNDFAVNSLRRNDLGEVYIRGVGFQWHRPEKGFQGGHVFKARRLLYHSSLGRE